MARTIRHAKLDTRSARATLAARKSPYWMPISRGCTLGYRKSTEGGRWLAKYVGEGIRRETTLGPSNDALNADGVTALDFAQAQEKALLGVGDPAPALSVAEWVKGSQVSNFEAGSVYLVEFWATW